MRWYVCTYLYLDVNGVKKFVFKTISCVLDARDFPNFSLQQSLLIITWKWRNLLSLSDYYKI